MRQKTWRRLSIIMSWGETGIAAKSVDYLGFVDYSARLTALLFRSRFSNSKSEAWTSAHTRGEFVSTKRSRQVSGQATTAITRGFFHVVSVFER